MLAAVWCQVGQRCLVAVIATSTLYFIVYMYRGEYAHLKWADRVGFLDVPSIAIPTSSLGNTLDSPDGALRHPPWIDTPQIFDVSQIPGYATLSATHERPLVLHHPLSENMERFLSRPILSHEHARLQNEAACPPQQLSFQVNQDQLINDRENWLSVSVDQIIRMRRGAVQYLERHSKDEGEDALIGPGLDLDRQPVVKGSRGVVFAAGNKRTVEKAIVCIKEMQKLGWQHGAIEVFHFEGELTDKRQRQELEDLGASPRMVSTEKIPGRWKNFELKAEAILRSSFDEVLYLDSDNYPLSDVRALFETNLFRDSRGGNAIFWPDLNRDHPDNPIHRLLGIPCHDAWELDSGQLLIAKSGNKGMNLAALYLAQHMAEEGDFWFSGGDKDTFRYAFLALGIPYTPAPRWLSLLGSNDASGYFCGTAMLQYGLTPPRPQHADPVDPKHPEPLFVHANLLKHQSGVDARNVFTLLRRLVPIQDDVRAQDSSKTALQSVTGGGAAISGRGLCSDIRAYRDGADVETVDTKLAYGSIMKDLDVEFFTHGNLPGIWR